MDCSVSEKPHFALYPKSNAVKFDGKILTVITQVCTALASSGMQ